MVGLLKNKKKKKLPLDSFEVYETKKPKTGQGCQKQN